MSYRHQGSIRRGVHGALYHSQSVEAIFANQPGLKIVMPSTPYDVKGLLKAAIRDDDPVLFFEHKRAYRLIKEEVPTDDYVLPIGKADVKRDGEDVTVITYGLCVHFALQAAERLASDGISVHILICEPFIHWIKKPLLKLHRKQERSY